jgi:hypothetical protein
LKPKLLDSFASTKLGVARDHEATELVPSFCSGWPWQGFLLFPLLDHRPLNIPTILTPNPPHRSINTFPLPPS